MISKAIKNASFLRLCIILFVGIGIALLSVPSVTYSATVMDDYCITPPFVSGGGVSPNLLLMIDNSASMNDLQYIDDSVDSAYCFDDTYNNSKICSETATTNCTVDADCPDFATGETCINQYAGYFEQDTVYIWQSGSGKFEDKGGGLEVSCDQKTDYLCVDIGGGPPLEVTTFEATGKFLNYLSSSKMDILKQILTGGKYVDKVCSSTTTTDCSVDADCPGGETCTDVPNFLEAESRGCVGKRFAKLAPLADFTSGGDITFGLRGTVDNPNDPLSVSQGGNTIIEIFEGRFDPTGCEYAIDQLEAGNLGQFMQGVIDCLELPAGGQSFTAQLRSVFNFTVAACLWMNEGKTVPAGTYTAIKNTCETIYGTLAPGDIQPDSAGYVCADRRVTIGLDGFVGQCWVDNGNAWSADGSCEETQVAEFCGQLEIPEVIDPTDSASSTGEFLNLPAFLIDSGVVAQLGEPIEGLNVKIIEATTPSGLIHDYENIIRFGVMRFNYCGSDSETLANPNIKLVCEDPDNPAEPNKDGSKIISYIGDTDTVDKINGIKASTWTPFAEAMYNAIAYYVKDATDNALLPAADFTAVNGAIQDPINESPGPPDPDFEGNKNPIQYKCQNNNVLLISDGASTADIEVDMTTKVTDITNRFNDGSLADDSAACGNYSGSTYLDDLSYFARNKNIFDPDDIDQTDDKAAQSIKTFVVYTGPETSTEVGECNAKTLMENTAINGGTSLFNPQDPASLGDELEKAFTDIAGGAASGTAASVLASGEGSGANLLQAIFYPKRDFQKTCSVTTSTYCAVNSDCPGVETCQINEIEWTGTVQNLWYFVDPLFGRSTIREDTDGNRILHLINDYFIVYGFDDNLKKTMVERFEDENGDYSVRTLIDSVEIEVLKNLWEAGRLLWSRDISAGADPRKIKTSTGSGLIDFDFTVPATVTSLKPYLQAGDDTESENIMRYIHGEDISGYRPRTVTIDINSDGNWDAGEGPYVWKLGDIINSTPKVVSWVPLNTYDLEYDDRTYKNFYTDVNADGTPKASPVYTNRGLIFTGANDGMFHAFKLGLLELEWAGRDKQFEHARLINPATGLVCNPADADPCGREVWSFIPKNVLPYLKYNADTGYDHIYNVDGTPFVFDASIGDIASKEKDPDGLSWRTVVIGSMKYGGASRGANAVCADCVKAPGPLDLNDNGNTTDAGEDTLGLSSYFALDITDPDSDNWTLLWEFSHEEMGLSSTGPSVVRINASVCKDSLGVDINLQLCNGEWFAVLVSGPTGPIDTPSNQFMGRSDQELTVFVLDLRDGSLKTTFKTFGGANITNAFGGSALDATIDPDLDYQDDGVYISYVRSATGVGDSFTEGGIIRIFTKENTDPTQWEASKVIEGIGPVTSAVARLENTNENKLWLFFGTGRYFYKQGTTIDDAVNLREIFGIKEPCYVGGTNPFTAGCTTTVAYGTLEDVTNNAAAPEDVEGWRIVLEAQNVPDSGFDAERVITDPLGSTTGVAFFTTFKPSADVCGYGGRSHLWAVKHNTGGAALDLLKGKALIQVSTGSIEEINLKDAFKQEGDNTDSKLDRRTAYFEGKPPEGPGLILLTAPLPAESFIHIMER